MTNSTRDAQSLTPGDRGVPAAEWATWTLHEVRRPVSLLNGYVEMLRERSLGPLTAAQDRVLERIAEKSMQLAQLLDAVETAVRLDKGRIPVYEVNVTHEVNDAVLRAQSRVEVEGGELNAAASSVVSALADRVLLGRILDTLIDNAVTYSDGPAKVLITVQKGVHGATVRVADRGIGISASAASRLFDRSFREHPENGDRPGWGLGLYMSRRAAEAMGGREWLERSTPGGGATFRLDLAPIPA